MFGWGTNDYLSTGVGVGNPAQLLSGNRDRGPVRYPAMVKGWLGKHEGETYKILSVQAGGWPAWL